MSKRLSAFFSSLLDYLGVLHAGNTGQAEPLRGIQDLDAGLTTCLASGSKRMWGKSDDVAIEYNGQLGARTTFDVEEAAPALLSVDSSGKGPGAILNQDGSLNTASNPAAKGSIVVLHATGEGQTEPPGVDGLLASNPLPRPRLPVTARIGYVDAEVLYAGAATGQVAGLMQVSVRVPSDAPSGSAVPIQIMVGSHRSAPTVSVAVRQESVGDSTLSAHREAELNGGIGQWARPGWGFWIERSAYSPFWMVPERSPSRFFRRFAGTNRSETA